MEGNPNVFEFEVILKEKLVTCVHNTDPEKIMEGIRTLGKTADLISNEPVEVTPEPVEKEITKHKLAMTVNMT